MCLDLEPLCPASPTGYRGGVKLAMTGGAAGVQVRAAAFLHLHILLYILFFVFFLAFPQGLWFFFYYFFF